MKGGGNIEEYFLLFFLFEFAIFFSSHFSSASAVSPFPPFWVPPEELWVFRRSGFRSADKNPNMKRRAFSRFS